MYRMLLIKIIIVRLKIYLLDNLSFLPRKQKEKFARNIGINMARLAKEINIYMES